MAGLQTSELQLDSPEKHEGVPVCMSQLVEKLVFGCVHVAVQCIEEIAGPEANAEPLACHNSWSVSGWIL